nr:hypothetical protein [Candidatus Sigynarchaeota archaeon]
MSFTRCDHGNSRRFTMLEDIASQRFLHGSIAYDFHFKQINEEFLQSATIRRLHEYLRVVQTGSFPNVLFNDPGVPRASRMRIKNVEKVQKTYLQNYLFEKGLVERVPGEKVPKMVQNVYDNFKDVQVKQKPAHEPVLKSILLKDVRSVAIELPVWLIGNFKHECLTGHVDLLQIEKRDAGQIELKVMDYKPEGESKFIFCMPQIALYALMLEKRLKPEMNCSINCYIFDRKATWRFKPHILQDIDDKLDRYGVTREWGRYLSFEEA